MTNSLKWFLSSLILDLGVMNIQFYEKLIFLMNLIQVSNRTLAQELGVDPSLISRLRTGARGIPHNREHVRLMAQFFAKGCTTEYQRQALSEMLESRAALTMRQVRLSELIYYWLCGENDKVRQFMQTLETVSLNHEADNRPPESKEPPMNSSIYYGNEGKREAAYIMLQYLRSLEKPCTVLLLMEESDDWMTEDYEFSQCWQGTTLSLLQRGFTFCQISPPTTLADRAFSSMTRWLPLYLTGRVDAFFYPRLRDNVYHRSLVVVPGKIALSSCSVGNQPSSYFTALTTDPRLTHAYADEFRDYLSMCKPMLNTYHTSEKLMKSFTRFLYASGTRIQKAGSLSADTAPQALLDDCVRKTGVSNLERLGRLYLQEFDLIQNNQEKYELIDIAPLASAEEVRAGKVPIVFSYGLGTPILFYTPETYVLHLKNILNIMENCSNYHFVPIESRGSSEGILMAREGQQALLVRTAPPFTVFELSSPDLVRLFQENLYRVADRIGYLGIHRIKIMSRIKELIRELQVP